MQPSYIQVLDSRLPCLRHSLGEAGLQPFLNLGQLDIAGRGISGWCQSDILGPNTWLYKACKKLSQHWSTGRPGSGRDVGQGAQERGCERREQGGEGRWHGGNRLGTRGAPKGGGGDWGAQAKGRDSQMQLTLSLNRVSRLECAISWPREHPQLLGLHHIQIPSPAKLSRAASCCLQVILDMEKKEGKEGSIASGA